MNWTALIPSAIALLSTLAVSFHDPIQAFVVAHPIIFSSLASVLAIVSNFVTPPNK